MSNIVFIGTVDSMAPNPFSQWHPTDDSAVRAFNRSYDDALQRPSPETLSQLKSAYRKLFPAMTPEQTQNLERANTPRRVVTLFNVSMYRGVQVHFKVKTLFKHRDDDGDDDDPPKAAVGNGRIKNDDDDVKPKPPAGSSNEKSKRAVQQKGAPSDLYVWTPFGDCGLDFQIGETYLVYADNDEDGEYIFADKCGRTRRVSDAGEDLTYLYFYKNQPESSARLEVFVTTDPGNGLEFNNPNGVTSPVADVIVQLKSGQMTRFVKSDSTGRSVFDGLSKGEYQVHAFADSVDKPISGPYEVRIDKNNCARQLLVVPRKAKTSEPTEPK